MQVKEYLKRICDLEKDILEYKLNLEKSNEELNRLKAEANSKKKRLQKDLKRLQGENKKQLESLRVIKEKLEKQREINSAYTPRTTASIVKKHCLLMGITVAIVAVVALLVIGAFGATTANDIILPYLIIYGVPTFFLWFCTSIDSGFSMLTMIIALFILLILVFLTNSYFTLCEALGINLILGNIIFAIIVLAIEAIIMFVACKNKDDRSMKDKKVLDENEEKYKQMESEITDKLEKQKNTIIAKEKEITDYNTESQEVISLMQRHITSQMCMLEKSECELESLYPILHPKYQNWVAAATIYEYFDIGRCYELKGPHGAYNIYEQELTAKKIVGSIEELKSQITNYHVSAIGSQRYIKEQLASIYSEVSMIK